MLSFKTVSINAENNNLASIIEYLGNGQWTYRWTSVTFIVKDEFWEKITCSTGINSEVIIMKLAEHDLILFFHIS